MKTPRPNDSGIALRLAFYGGLAVCVLEALGRRPSAAAMAAGSCMLLASLGLRLWAQTSLGPAWSEGVRIIPRHPLVTGGPYRHVRHPAYLSLVVLYLGAVIALGSVSGLLVFALGLIPALGHRIAVEEAALAAHFGEDYMRYAGATRRLVPGVF